MYYGADMKVGGLCEPDKEASVLMHDIQLGMYMKIPRRTLFVAQLIACILGTLTQSE